MKIQNLIFLAEGKMVETIRGFQLNFLLHYSGKFLNTESTRFEFPWKRSKVLVKTSQLFETVESFPYDGIKDPSKHTALFWHV